MINIILDDEELDDEAIAMNFHRYFRDLQHGRVRIFCDPAELEDLMRFGNTIRGKGEHGGRLFEGPGNENGRPPIPDGPSSRDCLNGWSVMTLLYCDNHHWN